MRMGSTSLQGGSRFIRRSVLPTLVALVACTVAPALVGASYLTGTEFPFDPCVQNTKYSRYYASLVSYKENPRTQTSQFCMQLHVTPTCTKGSYRCCNTHINKIKFFPADECRGSMSSALINGTTVTSVYWEIHSNSLIGKVTPLRSWLPDAEAVDEQVVCFNLRKPCWTMAQFAHDHELLEYALYDQKVNDYECCPVGVVEVPVPPEPTTPSAPIAPPDVPNQPAISPPPSPLIRRSPPPKVFPASPPPKASPVPTKASPPPPTHAPGSKKGKAPKPVKTPKPSKVPR